MHDFVKFLEIVYLTGKWCFNNFHGSRILIDFQYKLINKNFDSLNKEQLLV